MPRYYVSVQEVATYGVWVDADTPEKARDLGEGRVADAIQIEKGSGVELQGVSDREVVRVETEEEYAKP